MDTRRLTWSWTIRRGSVWTLSIGAWLVLPALGYALQRDVFSGLLPLTIWLVSLGAMRAILARREVWQAKAALAVATATGSAALIAVSEVIYGYGIRTGLLVAGALAWAVMCAAAIRIARSADPGRRLRMGREPYCALAGAVAVLVVLGSLDTPSTLAVRMAVLGLLISTVFFAAPTLASGQPSGRDPARRQRRHGEWLQCDHTAGDSPPEFAFLWVLHGARVMMVLTMCSMPMMANWCVGGGTVAKAILAVHVAAMFAPAALGQVWVARMTVRQRGLACGCLLFAAALLGSTGGSAAVVWLTPLIYGAAWAFSLGISLPVDRHGKFQGGTVNGSRRHRMRRILAAALFHPALAVFAMALLIAPKGPKGLTTVSLALGFMALVALALDFMGGPGYRNVLQSVRGVRLRLDI